jgi:hypothetical protein
LLSNNGSSSSSSSHALLLCLQHECTTILTVHLSSLSFTSLNTSFITYQQGGAAAPKMSADQAKELFAKLRGVLDDVAAGTEGGGECAICFDALAEDQACYTILY